MAMSTAPLPIMPAAIDMALYPTLPLFRLLERGTDDVAMRGFA
jgi:hypothetical protein